MSKPEATRTELNVSGFIADNFKAYDGDASFLAKATDRTSGLWKKVLALMAEELKKGVLDVDFDTPSTITSHAAGFIDKDAELIVGLQTDAPLKRGIKPAGGYLIVDKACQAFGYTLNPEVKKVFSTYTTTHNDAVFKMYTPEMRIARRYGIITGLPDGYGRGRIIGDYRRVALYGLDKLIELKQKDKDMNAAIMDAETMQLRLELSEQIKALKALKACGEMYGLELGRPAKNALEAIQWTYFGYLGSVKQQDGAAMSFGRVDAFLDIFIEKDIAAGVLTEEQAQELIDDFIMKLRIVRHLRTPEYDALFAGDPTWITFVLGGMTMDDKSMVTRTSYRIVNTLTTLGPAPEPNMTILWDSRLPMNWRRYCADISIRTSSIQYESDALMKPIHGQDYGIACCVSAMAIGKAMQFFGARCNLAKLLLYSLNNGYDEVKDFQVGPKLGKIKSGDDTPLDFEEVKTIYIEYMKWMAELWVSTTLTLSDTWPSVSLVFPLLPTLSAIREAKVYCVRDEQGIARDFRIEGEFPRYGNDIDSVDDLASWVVSKFMNLLREHKTYRNAEHSQSILTITSNVVYGKKTGSTPDGRKRGEPFAPGASPTHGADSTGALNSLSSVAKLPYKDAADGISNTFSITASALGKTHEDRVSTLVSLIDGYFEKGAHHLNVNVMTRETLLDAQKNPHKYPQLT
ncbi:Formate acetyltransferase, partial [Aduncisulcus paluster]